MPETQVQAYTYAAVALIFVIALMTWFFTRNSAPAGASRQASGFATPVTPRVIKGEVLGAGGGFAAIMLIIFSVVSCFIFLNASTVFGQIVALLTWIGNCTFWGIFIIVSAIRANK